MDTGSSVRDSNKVALTMGVFSIVLLLVCSAIFAVLRALA